MIKVAKIVKTVGLKGTIRVYPYSLDSSINEDVDIYIDDKKYEIKRMYYKKNMIHLELEDINSIDKAESLLNKEILMKRKDIYLEKDEYLVSDLLGFKVFEADNHIGELVDIDSNYYHDMYVVKTHNNEIKLIPSVKEFIKKVDVVNKKIIVKLIEGL